MEKSTQKRLIIGLVYLTFFLVICWFFYSIFKPKPNCLDGIQNQNEVGVDCGGICTLECEKDAKELVIGEKGVVESSIVGEYDFYAIVSNPNNVFGSKAFSYNIKFKDASGFILGERSGSGFILPGDKKYVTENNIKLDQLPVTIDFSISDSDWVELDNLYEKPNLVITGKSYNEISSGVGFSEAKGLLENKSPFDFALIKIKVILRNSSGKVVALNATEMRTVKSGENRDYRAFWPNRFPGEVANVENQIEVNIFDSEAFAKKYFKAERFQQYP